LRQRGLGRNVGRTWREPDGFASIGGTERNAAKPSRSGGAGNPAETWRKLGGTRRKKRKLKRGVVGSINKHEYDFWHGFRSQPPSLRLTCLPSGSARLPPGFCRRVSATRFPPGPARFHQVFRQRSSSSRLPLQCAFFCRVSSRLPPPYMPPRFR
jgi:hypothetical protein